MHLTKLRVKPLIVSWLSLILLLNSGFLVFASASSQTSSFTLQNRDNGFSGTYAVGSLSYLFSATGQGESHESRVQKGAELNVASCVLNKSHLTVQLSGVSIEFDLNEQTMSPLSDADRKALEDFSKGPDAAVVRDIITNIIAQGDNLPPQYLFGMVVIGMILGDGNNQALNKSQVSPNASVNKKPLSQLLQAEMAHAFENSPRKAEVIRECQQRAVKTGATKNTINTTNAASPGPCHGCCGPGCLGCTGIYTPECLVHDQCVTLYGYWDPRCLGLLVFAIRSYHQIICPACL